MSIESKEQKKLTEDLVEDRGMGRVVADRGPLEEAKGRGGIGLTTKEVKEPRDPNPKVVGDGVSTYSVFGVCLFLTTCFF